MDDKSHLHPPSEIDIHAADSLGRHGPKYGISLDLPAATTIISRIDPSARINEFRVSSRGYNNRLYWITTAATASTTSDPVADADSDDIHPTGPPPTTASTSSETKTHYILKVTGRYWHRTKTETETLGLLLAREVGGLPVPSIYAWDARGEEFGVEYTVMPCLEGVTLGDLWAGMSVDEKRGVVGEVVDVVVCIKRKVKTEMFGEGEKENGWIGNLRDVKGPRAGVALLEGEGGWGVGDVEIGPDHDGLGPWPGYKAFVKDGLRRQIGNARRVGGVLAEMSDLWPRVDRLIESIDEDENIPSDSELVFTHGDLDMQNFLVRRREKEQASRDSRSGPEAESGWIITAVLDWEWSGMFPAEEEFFASFGFVNDADLTEELFGLLEERGVATPRTIRDFGKREALHEVTESIAPWFLLDSQDVEGERAKRVVEEARAKVLRALEVLGY